MPSGKKIDYVRIQQLLAQGCTAQQIAQRLAITTASVHAVKRGDRK